MDRAGSLGEARLIRLFSLGPVHSAAPLEAGVLASDTGGSPTARATSLEPTFDFLSTQAPLLARDVVVGPGSCSPLAERDGLDPAFAPELGKPTSDVAREPATRSSPRLAFRDASNVLGAAVARKARLQDCGSARACARSRLSRKKTIELSRRCGVGLDEGEADSLTGFVSLDV